MTRHIKAPASHRGPHPLGQHLMGIGQMWQSGLNAAAAARVGMFPWHPGFKDEGDALASLLARFPADQMAKALVSEVEARIAGFQAGVDAYRRSGHFRPKDQRPVVWRKGRAKLLGPMAAKKDARVILVVPSLINQWHVLDLDPGNGLISRLESQGHAPYVLDWGLPGTQEAKWDCGDYVTHVLEPALDWLTQHSGAQVGVMGQCLGGVLALGLGQIARPKITGIALLATPWDFSLMRPTMVTTSLMAQGAGLHRAIFDGDGLLPADLVATLLAVADGGLIEAKYRRFTDLDPEGDAARAFVLIEDWAQTAIPLARRVGAQVFRDWPGGAGPAQNCFQVRGEVIKPQSIELPVIMVQSERDRLTPPAGARLLAEQLPNVSILAPDGGHLGMAIGREAGEIAEALGHFFLDHAPVSPYRGLQKRPERAVKKKGAGRV